MNETGFFTILLISWVILSVAVFIALFFISAPYGRHSRKGYGIYFNNRLGWLIMEVPSALLFAFYFFLGAHPANMVGIIFLVFWEAHYLHRAFIYPFSLPRNEKNMTIIVVVLGLFFNTVNAYINGRYLFTLASPYSDSWLGDPRFIFGAVLFIAGYIINRNSDRILYNLHRVEAEYSIPQGGFFNFVSCPNYLGEIVIWVGWAIATWSWPGLVFAVWTMANLIPRARSHHAWYRQSFADYPQNRKALIPLIW
jgi:3-oxo-5-alpha-steroid 4-dehydrogenase 1